MKQSEKQLSISESVYNEAYFLKEMEGAEDYVLSKGEKLTGRMQYALNIARIKPGQRILDLGCGRGEIIYQCARAHTYAHGLDFSNAAIRIAQSLKVRAFEHGYNLFLEQGTATRLPYSSGSFDIVFMLDIIEHLYPNELLATFTEVHRILRTGGRLIIHTMPNENYYNWGYPVYRILMGLLGKNLPKNPRLRWYRGETHVNVQTPRKLRNILVQAGFLRINVWLKPLRGSYLTRLLLNVLPWRWILINDIFAQAKKL